MSKIFAKITLQQKKPDNPHNLHKSTFTRYNYIDLFKIKNNDLKGTFKKILISPLIKSRT